MNQYSINIAWSDEDKGYIATIPEFKNLSAFGNTYEEALNEAKIVLEGYIESLESEGIPLPGPFKLCEYSGQTRLRMPKDLHKSLVLTAQKQGVSLNTYIVTLLSLSYTFSSILRISEEGKHIFITSVDIKGSDSSSTTDFSDKKRSWSLGSASQTSDFLEFK